MNKCKRYSKSYLPSALYPWSFPLMIIVIIISQSCAFFQPFKLKEFYTVNESLVPQKKFQQGEKVQVVISGDSSGTQTKTRLIGYDKAYGRTTSTYLTEEKETEIHLDIFIKNSLPATSVASDFIFPCIDFTSAPIESTLIFILIRSSVFSFLDNPNAT